MMKWINKRVKCRFDLHESLKTIIVFLKQNITRLLIFSSVYFLSFSFISISFNSSTKSLLDTAAFSCSEIAKSNVSNRVHVEFSLDYTDDISSLKTNTEQFKKAYSSMQSAYSKFNSGAFISRNDFYVVPSSPNGDSFEHSIFTVKFNNYTGKTKSLSSLTTSEGGKKYTTEKIVDGTKTTIEMFKKSLETLNVFLLFNDEKKSEGIPLYLPDYFASDVAEENGISLKECLGLPGTINVANVDYKVYIKNIIVTEARTGNLYDLTDHTFTENNVRFSKYLQNIFGNYVVWFNSSIYQTHKTILCSDFDSEFFKIKSYFKNDLATIYDSGCDALVFNCDSHNETKVFLEPFSTTNLNNLLKRLSVKQGGESFFDGALIQLIIGILSLVFLLIYLAIIVFSKKNIQKISFAHILLCCFLPFFVVCLFLSFFLFAFHSSIVFNAFVFSSASLVCIVLFSLSTIFGCAYLFIRKLISNEENN